MQNIKYLEKIDDTNDTFGVVLNKIALNHSEHIQSKIALSLLEFFNSGKFVDEKDIKKEGNTFFILKEKYFKPKKVQSKVFSIRVNLSETSAEIEQKIAEMKQKIEDYKNLQ